jgi:hypothetical protein
MATSNPPRKRKKKSTWVWATSLAALVFFNNCSSAPFEASTAAESSAKHRLPQSVAKQAFEFDCAHPSEKLNVSTALETIRLDAINCSEKIKFRNEKHPQPLATFPMGKQKFTSEFAYLVKGDNSFLITIQQKTYKVFVHRF